MFINLGIHSNYSLLMSSISIDDIINYAIQQKQKTVALIDIDTMYGAMEFYKKANVNNLKTIIGLQINYENEKVVLIAKNNSGYHQLVKISSNIKTNRKFNLNDYLTHIYVLVNDIKTAKWLKHRDGVFSINSSGDAPIAYHECFFEKQGDVKYVRALKAIANDQQMDELTNFHDYDDCYMWSEDMAKTKFSAQALRNLELIISTCSWTLENRHINFVTYDPKINSQILLQTKCRDGLKQRLQSNDAPQQYIDRLKKELEIIDHMHFNDYFLVVQDYVNFARRNGILVGPGRGSAAGSLVAYVLGITSIDPIEHDLIFERFLNPSRATMPDIDIDFMDNRRNEIIEYLFNKYGTHRVAHIITFQRMKAKMAIRDVGRILGIELPIINNISKTISVEYDLDLKKAIKDHKEIAILATKYEELFDLAIKFLNFPRQVGLHAAGIVMTNTTIDDVVPIQASANGLISTQYSMEYLEDQGLIKMDILGLVNLTTIDETIKLIRKSRSINITLEQIDLHDQKVFRQLTKGDTVGIFQLESPGMRNLIMKIKPTCIEDISITSALFRPGPQKNIPTYLDNKAHPQNIKYLNKDFEEVLKSTFNIIIYQEQVIEIVQRVAKFSLAESDLFRRAISKKNANKLEQLKQQFIKGGLSNDYSQKEIEQIFDFIYEFANYGFNHSHSLAYSYIGYWMAYLKTHYALEYFAVLLSTSENSVERISTYVQSARNLGIGIEPPSLNESSYSFSIQDKQIIFGFSAIKGIGYETINKIIEARNSVDKKRFHSFEQAIGILSNHGVGIKIIEILIKAGCFDKFLKESNRHYLLTNLPELFAKTQTMTTSGEMIIKPILKKVDTTKTILKELDDEQFKLLGVSFVEHPLTLIKKNYKGQHPIKNIVDIDENAEHIIVTLVKHREIKTKTNQAMAFVKIEDDTKIIDAAIFPGTYSKLKTILQDGQIYIGIIKANERGYQVIDLKIYS